MNRREDAIMELWDANVPIENIAQKQGITADHARVIVCRYHRGSEDRTTRSQITQASAQLLAAIHQHRAQSAGQGTEAPISEGV